MFKQTWNSGLPDPSWDEHLFLRDGHFLQSTHWGAFNQSLGRPVFFGAGPGWQCLAILERSNKATRIYCPHGPVAEDLAGYQDAVGELQALGRKLNAMFVRLEPSAPLRTEDLERLKHRAALKEIESSVVWVQDLRKPRQQLLDEFSSNNRQRLRNAHKKDIRIESSGNSDDVEILLRMVHEVAAHNNIVQHPDDYYRHMAKVLLERRAGAIYIARHQGEPVSAAMVFDSPTTRYVGHSGSLHAARKYQPGSVMRGTMLLDAKDRGQQAFDSLGVAPPELQPDHPWTGFTDFKRSFGGDYKRYLGTWEVPCNSMYHGYRAMYSAYSAAQQIRHRK